MHTKKPIQSDIRTMVNDAVWEKLIYFPILAALLVTHTHTHIHCPRVADAGDNT